MLIWHCLACPLKLGPYSSEVIIIIGDDKMPISITEDIAEEYYKFKGYVVLRNVGFLDKKRSTTQPGNIDIDVLAFNTEELLIISCKRGHLKKIHDLENELLGFQLAEKFLRGSNPDSKSGFIDIISKRHVKYVYIAEYITEINEKFLKNNNIETHFTYEILDELFDLLQNERRGFETKPVPSLIKCIIEHRKKFPKLLKMLRGN